MWPFTNNNYSNLIISSWPSAGGSTAARILALLLDYKYVYAGGVLKYWADQMGYDSKSDRIIEWSRKYHDPWDLIWENYVPRKIENSSRTLFEGKTAGFLLKKPKRALKIFITAVLKERQRRAGFDSRSEDIQKRDEFLRMQWLKLFNIDIFDMYQIRSKYDIVLDTSRLGISEVVVELIRRISECPKYRKIYNSKTMNDAEALERAYAADKNFLMQELDRRNLLLSPQEIMREWKSEKYSYLLKDLPKDMRAVVERH